jgi:hypothetical protein
MKIQFAILVGQPLLAVLCGLASAGRDSQEWLSYENLDPLALRWDS